MRRVIVTGEGGWIGGAVCRCMAGFPGGYEVRCVPVFGDSWERDSWGGADSVVHLAGIPGDGASEAEYRASNVGLTERVGRKCLADGVPHLVFMSTAHVYGPGAGAGGPIDLGTEPAPATPYGRSKLEAERRLGALEGPSLRVAVVRPPLVYGSACTRGNFPRLVRLAARTPVFPDVRNTRSMLYLGSLAELVRLLVDSGTGGAYLPQDPEWVCTSDLVVALGEAQGNRVRLSRALGAAMGPLVPCVRFLGKLFGDFRYDLAASECGLDYRVASTAKAVRKAVGSRG